jgi:hypothetical protein
MGISMAKKRQKMVDDDAGEQTTKKRAVRADTQVLANEVCGTLDQKNALKAKRYPTGTLNSGSNTPSLNIKKLKEERARAKRGLRKVKKAERAANREAAASRAPDERITFAPGREEREAMINVLMRKVSDSERRVMLNQATSFCPRSAAMPRPPRAYA